MKQTLAEFITKRAWQRPSNYAGETYFDYVCGLGQSRDSDILEISNFESLLEKLGGESKTVIRERAGHWAVGWVEQILVHKSDKKTLQTLKDILEDFNNYPVIDEDDYSERQHQYYVGYASMSQRDLARAIATHFGLPEECATDSLLQDVAFELNMQAQDDGGEDSCVNLYHFREPDMRDVMEFCHHLSRCEGNVSENPYYQYLLVACGMEGEEV